MNVEDNNGGDIEKQLDARLAELEAEQTKQINAALLAKRLADEEVTQRRRVEALDALVKEKGLLLLMTPAALAEALDKHGLEYDEAGLRELISKRPSIVDHRHGRKFLSEVPETKPEKKAKQRSDFPNSKDQFTLEQKTEFIHLFPEQWENMPLRPRASAVPLTKMTAEDWRSLTYAEKSARINELTAAGKDSESFITHLPRRKDS